MNSVPTSPLANDLTTAPSGQWGMCMQNVAICHTTSIALCALPIGTLKTCSVLELVPRYELGTYQPIGQ